MSVPIIANWADVEGEIQEIGQDEVIPEFASVTVMVHKANPVDNFANLLKDEIGHKISIFIPQELVNELGLSKGTRIKWRVRRAPRQRFFVHREHIVSPSED